MLSVPPAPIRSFPMGSLMMAASPAIEPAMERTSQQSIVLILIAICSQFASCELGICEVVPEATEFFSSADSVIALLSF